MRAGKATVGLLETEYIIIGVVELKMMNLLADVLEAGECLHIMKAVLFRHCLCEIRRDNGRDKRRILRKRSVLGPLAENVLADQHAGHISCEADILSGLRILAVDTETVSIRVSSEDDIRIHLLCQL